jgi:hypothetical protein
MHKNLIIIFLSFAAGSLGLERAAAQLASPPAGAPASNVAYKPVVQSSRLAQSPTSQANTAAQQPGQTKVVRIYGGAGYFDNALAEKLRPMLVKAFETPRPEAPKAVPAAAVATPVKSESQSKLTLAAHP